MEQADRKIDAHYHHAKRLHGAGHLSEAKNIYQQILTITPTHADTMDMLGVLLLQTNQAEQALDWIQAAIDIRPDTALFHVHRAHALLALGRGRDAETAARRAIALKRADAAAHQALGHALTDTGDYAGAVQAYRDAARLKPDLADILNNLGTALHHMHRLDEAAQTLNRALTRAPRDPAVLLNLSSVLRDLGRMEDAEKRLLAARRIAPEDPRIHYNNALLNLLLGRFDVAWPDWEARFRAGAIPSRNLDKPLWNGEPLQGRTLLIHAEQGLGDTMQFCRYDLPSDGPVLLEVQPRIARLIASRFRGGEAPIMRTPKDPLPPIDLQCPLMSLPAIRRTIPATTPYLFAEPDAEARWRERIGGFGFRVGIAWQGNPDRREDQGRSIPLREFLPLAALPDIRLIGLQRDAGAEQRTDDMPVEWLGDDFDSGPDGFIDTAAAMMHLDLVITSDTAIAHLAGALGRPVWVALRAVPDWRWMLNRPDSPWYPTMRLFRQTTRGDWSTVFAAMRLALEHRAEQRIP